MMNMTNRDIDILRTLALGVATFKMIMRLLCKVYGYAISDPALLRRLSILRRSGYITTRKEAFRKRHGHFTIYALTPIGASVLAELGLRVECIRVGLPKPFFVRHEINITHILHTVHEEKSSGHYKYNFMDSITLKQCRPKGSRTPIPDLQLSLDLSNRTIDLNVEVDLGTVLIHKMEQRIESQAKGEKLLLIMCNSRLRLHNLIEACSRAYFYGQENVLFVLLEDFFSGGFRNADLITIRNEKGRLKLDDE
jgi:hypothetical protein